MNHPAVHGALHVARRSVPPGKPRSVPGTPPGHIARAPKYDAMNPSAVRRWMTRVRAYTRLGRTPGPRARRHARHAFSAGPPRRCASPAAEAALDRLRSAIAQLPALHAEVFALHCFGDMRTEEIASIVGATRERVGTALRHARRQLQRMLSADRLAMCRTGRADGRADDPPRVGLPAAYLPP